MMIKCARQTVTKGKQMCKSVHRGVEIRVSVLTLSFGSSNFCCSEPHLLLAPKTSKLQVFEITWRSWRQLGHVTETMESHGLPEPAHSSGSHTSWRPIIRQCAIDPKPTTNAVDNVKAIHTDRSPTSIAVRRATLGVLFHHHGQNAKLHPA